MSDSNSDIDEAVASLPEQTLRRIDEAFDRAVTESRTEDIQRPWKRRRVAQDTDLELPGGFLTDTGDDDAGGGNSNTPAGGGGFTVETDGEEVNDNGASGSQPTHIPLSLIPRALQLLDLNPSDAQVLSVFGNAASSWSVQGHRRKPRRLTSNLDENEDTFEPEQLVSRRDWRAVCAALLPDTVHLTSPLTSAEESDAESRCIMDEESDSGSGAVQSGDLDESDLSEDEYAPGKGKSIARRRPGKNKSKPKKTMEISSLNSGAGTGVRPLTTRQMQDTLAAFALFFPGGPKGSRTNLTEDELSRKQLTIKDIAIAAASIKEKMTAEEIVEMLAFFSPSSTQNNPSMSFGEFQQMMISARLA